jgi:ubiquinol-cytochrome c reductase cytochrome b subunit
VWYFTPYYSLLRAVTYPLFGIDAKFWGVVAMGAGVLIFAFLPWLDRSPVKSIRYRGPIFKVLLAIWVVAFVILGFLGTKPPQYVFFGSIPGAPVAQILSLYYFLFFLTMPVWSMLDRCQPEPDRVTFK